LLLGERLLVSFQGTIGQAYLLYVPAPRFWSEGFWQHNAHGYRGEEVPLGRRQGVARVLCLGGSTTYGWEEADPHQSYPAHLEKMLDESPPAGWRGVEVINAGLPWGTTAEMLAHYHFKFSYYQPDLVILNAGGNDALGTYLPDYQPDYSHWRQPINLPRPLPDRTRFLLHSRLVAAAAVFLLYEPAPDTSSFVAPDGRKPPIVWYREGARPRGSAAGIAFQRNLERLVDLILADRADVLLVPFRTRSDHSYREGMMTVIAEEERFTEDLARRRNLAYAPFPRETISPENWADEKCHTNGAGNREKAAHIAPHARRLLSRAAQGR
jgi:lysophospholipase L1-like esterase